jgi:hypothetical protein
MADIEVLVAQSAVRAGLNSVQQAAVLESYQSGAFGEIAKSLMALTDALRFPSAGMPTCTSRF